MSSILGAPAVVPGSMAQGAADLPPVVWVPIAGAMAALLVMGVLWKRIRRRRREVGGEVEEGGPDIDLGSARMRELAETLVSADEASVGVLRWLVRETEATSAAYLELAPGAGERLFVAPRGLPTESVVALASRAREALTTPARRGEHGSEVVRWLGVGGSKCIVLAGPTRPDDEALRFARYMLEWLRLVGSHAGSPSESLVREIPGVAWADESGEELRVLLDEGANRDEVALHAHRMLAGSGLRLRWLETKAASRAPGPSPEVRAIVPEPEQPATALGDAEARVKILDVALSANGRVTADVRVTWNEHELRGRGHGGESDGGRHYAAAMAVADALRPLLDSDIEIRGLYTARTQDQVDVLIAEVELEGQRLVGAVLRRQDDPDLTGARAVLDAVNRRLTQIAGRSGRI